MGVLNDHDEIAPGWVHAMRITVAVSELRKGYVEAVKPRGMIDVPVPPDVDAVVIDVLLGAADTGALRIDSAFTVAKLARADGGSAAVIARPMALEAPLHLALTQQIAEARQGIGRFGWDGSTPTRMVIFGQDEGYLRQVEIAVDPD